MSIALFVLAAVAAFFVSGVIVMALKRFGPEFLEDFVSPKVAKVIIAVVSLVVVLGGVFEIGKVWLTQYHNDRTVTCTVTGRDRVSGNKRVYTKQCGTLTVNDSNWQLNRHSGDTYNTLTPGGTYKVRVIGSRSSLMSWFPNALGATPAK